VPAAICARMRSQISSKARRVWIGAKVGAARSGVSDAGGAVNPILLDAFIFWVP
jgi:hypothetical protein